MGAPGETTLVVLTPEAEELVRPFRERHDPSTAVGMPAHITILYPFKPPREVTADVAETLRSLFARFSPFTARLVELRRFPDVLYLAPQPADPFQRLSRAVVERFPETPPYRGAFSEINPHLTIAQTADAALLKEVEREVRRVARDRLAIPIRVAEVTWMVNATGRWEEAARFPLGDPIS